MAQKLTQRGTNPNPLTLADIIHAVSVADTTQSPQGSSYKNTLQALINLIKLSGVGNWKTVAPTVNNDSTQGYVNGAFWYDENAQKFYILNDNSAGAADWVVFDLQFAYRGGNVVNDSTVTIEHTLGPNFFKNGIGNEALLNNTGIDVNALGYQASKNNTGSGVNSMGSVACLNNTGLNINALGTASSFDNEGNDVNALGFNSGRKNTADDSNFFGRNAGYDSGLNTGNTTSHGVTVFSPESIPSYADQAAADAALTVANGCVAGQIYLWRLTGVTNVISFVIPT